ncbi:MAG TPA: twin-arginine translocase TatA/TatE family subunit [Rhizomicrobium sp.]|nr:twin-arginine translocase TatA/TatE family subunit [Rhizomicrobium sp.]
MFGLSTWHIVILLVVGFLLFGGKLSDLMGAAGRSLRSGEGLSMLGNRFLPPFLQQFLRALFK